MKEFKVEFRTHNTTEGDTIHLWWLVSPAGIKLQYYTSEDAAEEAATVYNLTFKSQLNEKTESTTGTGING